MREPIAEHGLRATFAKVEPDVTPSRWNGPVLIKILVRERDLDQIAHALASNALPYGPGEVIAEADRSDWVIVEVHVSAVATRALFARLRLLGLVTSTL